MWPRAGRAGSKKVIVTIRYISDLLMAFSFGSFFCTKLNFVSTKSVQGLLSLEDLVALKKAKCLGVGCVIDLLGAGVLGDSLGSLRHGVLGQLSGEEETSLNGGVLTLRIDTTGKSPPRRSASRTPSRSAGRSRSWKLPCATARRSPASAPPPPPPPRRRIRRRRRRGKRRHGRQCGTSVIDDA